MFYTIFLDLCRAVSKSPTTVLEEIGLGRGNITNWKNGTIPSDKILRKIAIYFDVPQKYLLDGTTSWTKYYDPTATHNRVFQVMNRRKMSFDDLVYESGCTEEEIRDLAFSNGSPSLRRCLERVARVLDVNPLYLIGKSESFVDDGTYDQISDDIWKSADEDPQKAIDAYRFMDGEMSYIYGMLNDLSEINMKDYFRSFSQNGIYLFADKTAGISKKKFKEIVHFIQFTLERSDE